MCPLCGRCLHAGSARDRARQAQRREGIRRERGRIAAPFSIAEQIKDLHADPATRGCSKPRPKWHAPGAAELASLSKSEICTQIANGSGLKQIGVLRVRIFDSLSTTLGAHHFDRLAPTGWVLYQHVSTWQAGHAHASFRSRNDWLIGSLSYLTIPPAPRPACCGAPPGWRAVRRPAWQTIRRERPARGARRLRPAPSAAGSAAR